MAYYGGFQLEGERKSAISDLEREIKKQQDIQLAGEVEGKKRGFLRRLARPLTMAVPGLDYLIHEKYEKGVKKGDIEAIKGKGSPFAGKRGLRAAEAMGERQEAGDVPYWETYGKERLSELKGGYKMGKAIITKDPTEAVEAVKGRTEDVIGGAFDEPEEYGDPRTEQYQGYRLGGRVPMYQEGGGITPDIISQLIQKKYGTTDFDETEEMMGLDRKFGDPGKFRISPSKVDEMAAANPEARKKWDEQLAAIEERKASESGFSGLVSKLFNRNKSKYAGGGRVPSISEYFGMQNKSLGGSNTNTLSEMLGIK